MRKRVHQRKYKVMGGSWLKNGFLKRGYKEKAYGRESIADERMRRSQKADQLSMSQQRR